MLAIRKCDQPLLDAATAIRHDDRQTIHEAMQQSKVLTRESDLWLLAGYVWCRGNRLLRYRAYRRQMSTGRFSHAKAGFPALSRFFVWRSARQAIRAGRQPLLKRRPPGRSRGWGAAQAIRLQFVIAGSLRHQDREKRRPRNSWREGFEDDIANFGEGDLVSVNRQLAVGRIALGASLRAQHTVGVAKIIHLEAG